MFLRFNELFGKQLQKLTHFVTMHENSSIWPQLWNFFKETTMFWCFDELFSKRLQKVAQFGKKHEKSSIWPRLCNFSRKLPCLSISINFSEKNLKKVSFRKKARKIMDFANSMKPFEQTTMFLHFEELLRKRLEKVVHFVKKQEKSWIGSQLATFLTKYHVFKFR